MMLLTRLNESKASLVYNLLVIIMMQNEQRFWVRKSRITV